MDADYTAISYLLQQLKVNCSSTAIELMVNDPENAAFSERLNELLDERSFSAKGRGRQVELAKKYDLVQQSVGKWLKGEGMPKTTQMMRIARDFKCNFEWLALGSGPRDADPNAYGPHADLVRRIEAADPETVRLIDIALLPHTDLEKTPLSPSLKGLVGAVKSLVREEMNRGAPPRTS